MNPKQKNFMAVAAVVAFGALAPRSASAVVLEQKYVASQSASYDMTMSGNIKLQAGQGTPVPWAGIPLDVPVTGSGQLAFDTLTTNNLGGATVRTRIPFFKFSGAAFGMNAVVSAKDGVANFSLNGAPGKTFPVPALIDPTYALNVSRLGRVEGVTAIPSRATQKTALSSTRLSTDANPQVVRVASENGGAVLQRWLDVMPNIWPGRDIKVGENWTVVSKIPVTGQPNGTLDLGTLNFKLLGQETEGGVALQRIAVNGTFVIDAAKAAIINAQMPRQNPSKGTARLVSDTKTVNGDIWFNAAEGRVARLSMKIAATNVLAGTRANAAGQNGWSSTQSFNGVLGMQLNGVTTFATKARAPIVSPKVAS